MSPNNQLPPAQFTCVRNQYYMAEEVDRYLDEVMAEFAGMRVERMRLETEIGNLKKQLAESSQREHYMMQAVESSQQTAVSAASNTAALENEIAALTEKNQQLEQSIRMTPPERPFRPPYPYAMPYYEQPGCFSYPQQDAETQRLREELVDIKAELRRLTNQLKSNER